MATLSFLLRRIGPAIVAAGLAFVAQFCSAAAPSYGPSAFASALQQSATATPTDTATPAGTPTPTATATGRSGTSLTVAPASGSYRRTANLSATLKSGATPLEDRTILFKLNGATRGTATTNVSGVASLWNVDLGYLNAGSHPGGIQAVFAGDADYLGSSNNADLVVQKAGTCLFWEGGHGQYGGTAYMSASLFLSTGMCSDRISAGSGLAVRFRLLFADGTIEAVGGSLTDSGGVAVLSNVSLGDRPAGTYAVSVDFTGDLNHWASNWGESGISLPVARAPLTVKAANATKVVGDPLPPFTVSYSGFVLDEDPSVLGGVLAFDTTATASSPPGSYPIVPRGLTSSNYAITSVAGTLTVVAAPTATLTPTATATQLATAAPTATSTATPAPTGTPGGPPTPTPTATPVPTPAEQRIPLHQGWNWFSFAVAPAPTGLVPTATAYFREYFGAATLEGAGLPVGSVVEAFNPRGDLVGSFTAGTPGWYGYMRVYGEDPGARPPIPGMRAGEAVSFRVGGLPAATLPAEVRWENNPDPLQVDLSASSALPVAEALASIAGRYDLVIGETGTYAPPPARQFLNTLATLAPGRGYFLRATAPTDLVLTGRRLAEDTPMPLAWGWHWIGYLPPVAMPVPEALGSIAGSYDYILGEHGTYGVSGLQFLNTLDRMEPGRGYLIRMTRDGTLVYGPDG